MLKNLFIDIGGVIMTNGWDRFMRAKAALKFGLDIEGFEERHRNSYDIYESGKMSLDEYLDKVVFFTKRPFDRELFKEFMFDQSQTYPDMIAFFSDLKSRYDLRISAISNEGKELADYRIKKANLTNFIDDFFISGYLGIQKPNEKIYRMALDVTQAKLDESFYIDDRKELVEAALKVGLKGTQQKSLLETSSILYQI